MGCDDEDGDYGIVSPLDDDDGDQHEGYWSSSMA